MTDKQFARWDRNCHKSFRRYLRKSWRARVEADLADARRGVYLNRKGGYRITLAASHKQHPHYCEMAKF